MTLTRRTDLSPDRPYLVIDEREADGHGGIASVRTVFLTASECPIGCTMCDLWQNTLTTPTPAGAIGTQIDAAVADRERADWIKLYNSGNFFDPQSIPPDDYEAIADRCRRFDRVIVENHPAIGRSRLAVFRDLLATTRLEIAVGLETVQPRWLGRLGKRMTRDDFDGYARRLGQLDIDLRVFLIVGVPDVSQREAAAWARLSVRHAIGSGARHISLIPARPGHGWGDRVTARRLASWSGQAFSDLLVDCIRDADGSAVVTLDLWDAGFSEPDRRRISELNLTQNTG